MKRFEILTMKSTHHKVVVATSYVNPLGKVPIIEKELQKMGYKGIVLFDLLLSNGFASNRFLTMEFNGEKLNTRNILPVTSLTEAIQNELFIFYSKNIAYVEKSSLTDIHKQLFRNSLSKDIHIQDSRK